MKRQFHGSDGRTYQRESRWLEIKYKSITKRHSLWDYVGGCDGDDDRILSFFVKNGKQYALGQFMRFDNQPSFKDGDEEIKLSGYDCTCYYRNYLIEINETGEAVRLYTLVPNN